MSVDAAPGDTRQPLVIETRGEFPEAAGREGHTKGGLLLRERRKKTACSFTAPVAAGR